MTRRLIEDLMIDLFRAHFGDSDIHKYYVPQSGRHKRLGELIGVFGENIEELANYTTAVDKPTRDLTNEIEEFVNRADSQAHSVNIHISKDEITRHSEDATRIVQILLEMRTNARSS